MGPDRSMIVVEPYDGDINAYFVNLGFDSGVNDSLQFDRNLPLDRRLYLLDERVRRLIERLLQAPGVTRVVLFSYAIIVLKAMLIDGAETVAGMLEVFHEVYGDNADILADPNLPAGIADPHSTS